MTGIVRPFFGGGEEERMQERAKEQCCRRVMFRFDREIEISLITLSVEENVLSSLFSFRRNDFFL